MAQSVFEERIRALELEDARRREQQEQAQLLALQAKHRQEEAAARSRQKERSQRTHRLIQLGAILESVYPAVKQMEPETVREHLKNILRLPIRQEGDE